MFSQENKERKRFKVPQIFLKCEFVDKIKNNSQKQRMSKLVAELRSLRELLVKDKKSI